MVDRPRIKKRRYFFALTISLLLFFFGFLLGYWTVDSKLNYLIDQSDSLRLEAFDYDLERDLVDLYPCDHFASPLFESSLVNLEGDIGMVESTTGYGNPRLIYLKNYYSLLELKHWLFFSKYGEVCSQDYVFVFYFYSNDEEICADCLPQGYILSRLRDSYDNVKVYSFDSVVSVNSVDLLRQNYNISVLPSLVINEEVYEGYVPYDDLVSIFDEESALLSPGKTI
tara:strand:- start:611 stop:1288 length:678 start_codon:yes stop_codon:yes gene_type:complete